MRDRTEYVLFAVLLVLLVAIFVIAIIGLLNAIIPVPPPTISPTVTTIPQVITPTVTSTPHIVATVEVVTPNVPKTGTPTQQPKTATVSPSGEKPTPWATATAMVCRHGVITAHAAISAVLANKPDRACEGCVYYASVMCQDIGKDYELRIGISKIKVRVVDCATWAVGEWPKKNGLDWLGELDIRSWPNMPIVPLEAALCE